MSQPDLGFIHRYLPAEQDDLPVLLLLHGTGGDEGSMLPIGRQLLPGATMLSPRGKVLENGMPRFFRRLAEGVFDLEDLRLRSYDLAGFVESAAAAYRFDISRVVAIGYSNGANIAASMLLLRPGLLGAAVLFRAMVPLEPPVSPDLNGTGVFIAAGRRDPLVPGAQSERLAILLGEAGAAVTLHWQDADHALRREELVLAQSWLRDWTAGHVSSGAGPR